MNAPILNGIIDIDDVRTKLEMKNRQEILKSHEYKIWQGSNELWYTYLPDTTKKNNRRLIKRKTEEELNTVIVEYYRKTKMKQDMTLESLYPEWLNYYKVHTTKTASVKRYSTEWTRYYISDPIIKKPLKNLTTLMLDEWVHSNIQRHQMTKKQYYTMSFILRRCMIYAETNGYIQENVFAKVKVNSKMFRKVQKKPDYTQVYLAHEQPLIIDEAWKDYNKNPENTTPLAVILMFYLAVRPGEIVALQESDFRNGLLSIQRMESGEFEEIEPGKYTRVSRGVAEHTKTDAGDRDIPLIKKAIDIITLVMKVNAAHGNSGGYLFLNNGERIKESGISWRLEKYCNHLNIPYRSPHKIRKTAISCMIDGGMNINTIRKFVGHEDERTTYNNYCYDRRTSEQVLNQLENALDNNTAVNILPFINPDKKQVITSNQIQAG